MLIALTILIIALLGSSSGDSEYFPEDLKKRVKAEISDKALRKEVDAIAKRIDKDIADYQKEVEALALEELNLSADYDAEFEKFEDIVDRIVSLTEESQKKLINDRLSLATLLTEDQWNAVFVE